MILIHKEPSCRVKGKKVSERRGGEAVSCSLGTCYMI